MGRSRPSWKPLPNLWLSRPTSWPSWTTWSRRGSASRPSWPCCASWRAGLDLAAFGTEDLAQAHVVVERYADQSIGLADASIVILAARYQTRTVVTLDRRHFGSFGRSTAAASRSCRRASHERGRRVGWAPASTPRQVQNSIPCSRPVGLARSRLHGSHWLHPMRADGRRSVDAMPLERSPGQPAPGSLRAPAVT